VDGNERREAPAVTPLPGAISLQAWNFDAGDYVDVIAAGFALVLLALSLFVWTKRRQRPLIVMSAAFGVFVVKIIVEISPIGGDIGNLLSAATNLGFLSLFFLAVVLRPSRGASETDHPRTEE
jgi:hypothetical protein